MKTALVLGGGGFIGGHLAKRLKDEGFWVCIIDIKEKPEFFNEEDICDLYVSYDLRLNSSPWFLASPQSVPAITVISSNVSMSIVTPLLVCLYVIYLTIIEVFEDINWLNL